LRHRRNFIHSPEWSRAYKAEFIKNLNLKAVDYEINPEILYKAMILRARIIEIPAASRLELSDSCRQKKDFRHEGC